MTELPPRHIVIQCVRIGYHYYSETLYDGDTDPSWLVGPRSSQYYVTVSILAEPADEVLSRQWVYTYRVDHETDER